MGRFYGIGVGPGDPELLTLKGYKILQQVNVICTPRSKKGRPSLALSIIKGFLRPAQKIVELDFPMKREMELLQEKWYEAAGVVFKLLRDGLDVAFVTLGDPMFYSTYGYLLKTLLAMAPELEVQTVPGITSITAAAAVTGRMLAVGDEGLAVLSGFQEEQFRSALDNFDHIVVLKVAEHLPELLRILEERSLRERGILVSRLGLEGETVSELSLEFDPSKADYLSILIIHKR